MEALERPLRQAVRSSIEFLTNIDIFIQREPCKLERSTCLGHDQHCTAVTVTLYPFGAMVLVGYFSFNWLLVKLHTTT